MAIEMQIKGLMIDPVSNMPIIILKNSDGEAVLPIWVGIFEANAIAMQLEKITSPRPMTHDLLRNVIQGLDVAVERVEITDLRENTFYAQIHLRRNGESLSIVKSLDGQPFLSSLKPESAFINPTPGIFPTKRVPSPPRDALPDSV